MKNIKRILVFVAMFGFILGAEKVNAVQSPIGCTADNSVVNISSNVSTATEGDIITFSVDAGNPASGNGCDITGRTMTLTLPNGISIPFGPFDYPNPTAVAFVGSAPYVANNAHAVGGFWVANVAWNGTLKGANDQPSGGSKNASVTQIMPLQVSKTANTSFDRTWDWNIVKVVDDPELVLSEGQIYTVNYDVDVTATPIDSNKKVTGTITITNPNGNPAASISGINDVLNSSGAAVVDCTVDDTATQFPIVLSGGQALNCTYEKTGASSNDNKNTVTVSTTGSVPGGSGEANVVWSNPSTETDECIIVDDTNANGPQDQVVCAGDAPKNFSYTVTFGPQDGQGVDVVVACATDMMYPNTATFMANDTPQTDSDDASVHVVVNCFQGCTLTQGYWKTHSALGKAPYDNNWANIPTSPYAPDDGDVVNENHLENFFLSGNTWYGTFWTAPKGNSYYNLAHQYEAAVLNKLNGASVPGNVQAALDSALALLTAKTPAQVFGLKGAAKSEWINLAGILGSYNEGKIGPGHCDEQNPN